MAGRDRFRYALEPVRLTRQWELDGVLVELGDANAALAVREEQLQALLAQAAEAEQEWRRMSEGTAAMQAGRFMLLANYLGDCRLRLRDMEAQVREAESVRDALAERATAVRKGLDAVEEHRDKMRAAHARQRQSSEFKEADDHWGVTQARANDDHD
jgi:flagellar biosynthesis chaperone FliJ